MESNQYNINPMFSSDVQPFKLPSMKDLQVSALFKNFIPKFVSSSKKILDFMTVSFYHGCKLVPTKFLKKI